jgi:hypothetical protein
MTGFVSGSRAAMSGAAVLATILAAGVPVTGWGQSVTSDLRACYVPGSGTIYRIKTPGTPNGCTGAGHVEFALGASSAPAVSAAKGPGGGGGPDPVDHGTLGGLLDDDHPQYLLANGVRGSLNGFAVTASGFGAIPVSGQGTRMMWYPGKAAFRAGRVGGDNWDDVNTGLYSVAMGFNTTASGLGSVALGEGTQALAPGSFVFGTFSSANGNSSIAMGNDVHVSGSHAVGIGSHITSSATGAVGIGLNVNADKLGSFVIGDASSGTPISPAADNQFAVRAQKVWFGTHSIASAVAGRYIETSTGAFLSTGGTWTNSSDENRKDNFADVDGESVLSKLAALPILSWNYRDEDSTVRHMGPTAQAFRAAYGLGDSEIGFATVDADGIALAAAQALERRTRDQALEITELRTLVRELQLRLEQLARGTTSR